MANQVHFIESGPCATVPFYHKYLSATPIFSRLILRNLNAYPFIGEWLDNDVLTMSYIVTYGRALALGIGHPEEANIYSACLAELLGPYLPETLFLNEADSRGLFINSVRAIKEDANLLRRIAPNASEQNYNLQFDANPQPIFHPNEIQLYGQPVNGDWASNDIRAAIRILKYLAKQTIGIFRKSPIAAIANITVSISKRGTVSDDFIRKIETGITDDIGVVVELHPEMISIFYRHFAQGINDDTIVHIRRTWLQLIPNHALRLQLTVTQLTGSGLTSYITIVRSLLKYGDFRWDVIQRAFPTEWANLTLALNTVADNLYWGFRRDLGVARSTKFKSISYVAKELLIRAGGEITLSRYAGWPRTIKFRNEIDQLIVEYVNRRAQLGLEVANQLQPPEVLNVLNQVVPNNFPAINNSGPN